MSVDSDPLPIRRLETWFSQAWNGPSQASFFIYSPEWNSVMRDAWSKYEETVLSQHKQGLPRLPWQDAVEDQYRSRPGEAVAPQPRAMHSREPLWVHLRSRRHQRITGQCRIFAWDTAVNDWENFRQLYQKDDRFVNSLSTTQRAAYHTLEDWWTAAFCDISLPAAVRGFLDNMRNTWTNHDPMDSLKSIAAPTKIDESLYQSLCFRLWLFEFHPRTWEPFKLARTTPDDCLHLAHLHSLPAKMAHAVLHPRSPLDHKRTYPPYQSRVLGEVAEDFHRHLTLTTMSQPYYLWDSKARMTVEVSSFAECPPYTCISHTWGRWRAHRDERVSGVPWKVPGNTLYDVKDLPVLLSRLGDPYIWFDLFCIPQDNGERSRRDMEVAKQGSIFRRCQRCIAWLHDVQSWDRVLKSLDWLCLEYLRGSWRYPPDLVTTKLASAALEAAGVCELMIWDHEEQKNSLSSWFSSLWTLQEAALCPDIQLYNKHWQRLDDRQGVAIPARVLIEVVYQAKSYLRESPLDCPDFSQSIHFNAIRGGSMQNRAPLAVKNLIQVQMHSNLRVILSQGSPIAVLLNGHRRKYSSRNRAPALMSSLGVTEWYEECIDEQVARHAPDTLVLDMYPLHFLREAAAKFGGLFFDIIQPPISRQTSEHNMYASLTEFHRGQVQGTLLPVSADPSALLVSANSNIQKGVSHPSLSDWTIESDASVSISSAGVIMTSEDPPGKSPVAAHLCISVPDERPIEGKGDASTMRTQVKDLRQALKDAQCGGRRLYAVALMSFAIDRKLIGVILEEIPQQWSQTRYMKKIGCFSHVEQGIPPSVGVDWKVL